MNESKRIVNIFEGDGESFQGMLWYWNTKAGNGRIIGSSVRGCDTPEDAIAQVHLLAHHLAAGTEVQCYVDAKGEHRWRIEDAHGTPVGKSSEGYNERRGCDANIEALREFLSDGYFFKVLS